VLDTDDFMRTGVRGYPSWPGSTLRPDTLMQTDCAIHELPLADGAGHTFSRRAHQGRHAERKAMIDRSHPLPLTRQAQVLKLSRSSLYYQPRPVTAEDLAIMRRIDELHLEHPFAVAGCCATCCAERASRSAVSG
jgi:hypothetical protein